MSTQSVYYIMQAVLLQVEKIVGKGAPEGFIGQLESLANGHHDQLEVDVIRAYYFGSRFIVEVRCIQPRRDTDKICIRRYRGHAFLCRKSEGLVNQHHVFKDDTSIQPRSWSELETVL